MTTPPAAHTHPAHAPVEDRSASRPDHLLPHGGGVVHQDASVRLILGECVEVLRTMADASVDAVVTDPPYAIGRPAPSGSEGSSPSDIMSAPMLGMQSQNWHARATHSRGYADNDNLAFAQWCSVWVHEVFRVLKPGGHLLAFGGTRTWHRLACAIEDAGFEIRDSLSWLYATGFPKSLDVGTAVARRTGHDSAERRLQGTEADFASTRTWEGWGTGLKPAQEPIVMGRKPLQGTVAANVLAHGIGALNVGATRIGATAGDLGRWPTNVFFDEYRAQELDATSDCASRFFWVAKPGTAERPVVDGVAHPTVKPVDLMRQLIRLVTPERGTVLDPFAGSGSTVEACLLEGVTVIAVEREAAYIPLIIHRISRQQQPLTMSRDESEDEGLFELPRYPSGAVRR